MRFYRARRSAIRRLGKIERGPSVPQLVRRRLPLVALTLYAILIIAIITVANRGGTHEVFALVHRVPYGDKLGHFVLIGVLAALADLGLRRRDVRVARVGVPLGPAIVAALAVLEELSQLALPTRSFDLGDLAADAAGIVTFVALGRWVAARPRAV